MDHKSEPLSAQEGERRTHPVIKFDFGFVRADRDRAGELVKVLIMVDVWTRMVKTAVVDSKGNPRHLGETVVRFSLELNRYECTEYVSDGEPSTKAILEAFRFVRQNLGLSSIITIAQPGDKGRTAIAERSIQTVRRQWATLVAMIEDKCEIKIPQNHPIWSWGMQHAALLICRHMRHTLLKGDPV